MKNIIIEEGAKVNIEIFLDISSPVAKVIRERDYDYCDSRTVRLSRHVLRIGETIIWNRPDELQSAMDFNWKHESTFDTSRLIGVYKKIGMKKGWYTSDRFGGRDYSRDLILQNIKHPDIRLYQVWGVIPKGEKESILYKPDSRIKDRKPFYAYGSQ